MAASKSVILLKTGFYGISLLFSIFTANMSGCNSIYMGVINVIGITFCKVCKLFDTFMIPMKIVIWPSKLAVTSIRYTTVSLINTATLAVCSDLYLAVV